MIDYYAMPQKEPDGWPGRARSTNLIASETKARCVEDAMLDNIVKEMGDSFDPSRFVPFVMMQEFEALPFSDCAAFSRAIYSSSLEPALRQIRSQFTTPEY